MLLIVKYIFYYTHTQRAHTRTHTHTHFAHSLLQLIYLLEISNNRFLSFINLSFFSINNRTYYWDTIHKLQHVMLWPILMCLNTCLIPYNCTLQCLLLAWWCGAKHFLIRSEKSNLNPGQRQLGWFLVQKSSQTYHSSSINKCSCDQVSSWMRSRW